MWDCNICLHDISYMRYLNGNCLPQTISLVVFPFFFFFCLSDLRFKTKTISKNSGFKITQYFVVSLNYISHFGKEKG